MDVAGDAENGSRATSLVQDEGDNPMQGDEVNGSEGLSRLPVTDEEKERSLQSERQVWAVFDALGPGKARNKCPRPLTGRAQDAYERFLPICTDIHIAKLHLALGRESLAQMLSTLESLLIARRVAVYAEYGNPGSISRSISRADSNVSVSVSDERGSEEETGSEEESGSEDATGEESETEESDQ